ncbi:helix-turn-helix domain-containing protein [Stutzerimonas stutzeri]|jgi:excisionase family DNA binding protein|uniref:helix-turn-helix domain-containing protein n=1 Tax=Stutzerimonas stutzeri TaxID=316 RepID=UPI0002F0C8FB|nr:helix-turn-helix domain-containing protein [Stutzerimonas stutzeri]RRW53361.1 DNA-binding protein [Stutzerimonas stutzeri]
MAQPATLQPLAVRPEEAAHVSGTTRTAVYEAIARGDLMSFKAGRRRLILVEELRAWLNRMAKENAR